MIRGLLARLAGRPARPDRLIFRFFDGRRQRAADPLEVWRSLEAAAGPDWQTLLVLLAVDPPPGTVGAAAEAHRAKQEAAAETLGRAALAAFGVEPLHPYEKRGLTRAERVGLVGAFLNFMGGLAESARCFRGAGGGLRAAPGPDLPGPGGPVAAPEAGPPPVCA